ncbi:MAG: NAD(P)-dependent oxidoreductase [Chloroflexi bacterium]|nr:NAD(P)-dependent oxidoreductase [Chloroflexota bacterium]
MSGRVLVTGATGFIGRHAAGYLLDRGYEVVATTSGPLPHDERTGVTWLRADLLRDTDTQLLVEEARATHLLHLAWYYQPRNVYTSVENVRWVEASLRLLRSFVAGPRACRVVLAGSCAEYGASAEPADEIVTPVAPVTVYGQAKHATAILARHICESADISLANGRVFFVFGPGEHPERLVSSVARALLTGREAPCSHGTQVRDFQLSRETAAALVALVDCDVRGPVNIGSGEPLSIREVVEYLGLLSGRPELVQLGARPALSHEQQLVVPNLRRLTTEVGFEPSSSVREGLELTFRWWAEQPAEEHIAPVRRAGRPHERHEVAEDHTGIAE